MDGLPRNLTNEVLYQQKLQDQWTLHVSHYIPWLIYWWKTWFPSFLIADSLDLLFPFKTKNFFQWGKIERMMWYLAYAVKLNIRSFKLLATCSLILMVSKISFLGLGKIYQTALYYSNWTKKIVRTNCTELKYSSDKLNWTALHYNMDWTVLWTAIYIYIYIYICIYTHTHGQTF